MIELMKFRNGNVRTASGDNGDDLLRITTSEAKALDKQPVTSDDRFCLPGLGVDGGDSSALLCLIVDVIVDQRGGVNQLKCKSEWHDVVLLRTACKLVGQKEKKRAQSLSTGVQHPSGFQCNLTSPHLDLGLNEVMKGLIDLATHPLKCGIKRLNIAAHDLGYEGGLLNRSSPPLTREGRLSPR